MKYSVSSYSFNQLMQKGELNQFTAIAKAAELKFDAIEFIDLAPHDGSNVIDYAKRLKAEAQRVGIAISGYSVGADFLAKDYSEELERLKKQVDVAAALGVKFMRHDTTVGDPVGRLPHRRSFDEVLPIISKACREIAEYAEPLGVTTMVENHGLFCQHSSRMEKLFTAVAHPNFALLADIGNFLCADDSPEKACGIVAPFVKSVHIKDFYVKSGNGINPGEGYFRSLSGNYLRGTIVGHGDVPVKQCLDIFKAAQFDGYYCIEFEGMENCLDGIRIGYDNLKRLAAE